MLFEPLTVRQMTLKNRIVMPAMLVGMGLRGQRARAYYSERGRGGAAAIITAGVPADFFAMDDAFGKPGGLADFLEGVKGLTQAVHEAGAKIGAQIWYGNRYPAGRGVRESGGSLVAPSPQGGKAEGGRGPVALRELTVAEIEDLVLRFGRAAAGVRQAGFDLVEFHGAHGSLGCQFFSPRCNQRQDGYGGDLRRRMRFGLECVQAMRRAVGPDFPIFFRIGAWEPSPGGVTVEESVSYAQELEKAGVDVIDVSLAAEIEAGNPDHILISPDKKSPMATFAWIAAAIKKGVGIPVMAVGRINSHKIAEEILQQGKADLVALGRQLIADPYWPAKVREGRFREIIPCDSCNQECWGHIRGGQFGCHKNPHAGRESEVVPPIPA